MIVAISNRTNEVAISGTAAEYRSLAKLLHQGHGSLILNTESDVSPYHAALETLAVETTGSPGVQMTVSGTTFLLSGPLAKLTKVAGILNDSAEVSGSGGHVHMEHYENHSFLDPSPISLVIADPS